MKTFTTNKGVKLTRIDKCNRIIKQDSNGDDYFSVGKIKYYLCDCIGTDDYIKDDNNNYYHYLGVIGVFGGLGYYVEILYDINDKVVLYKVVE